MLKILLMPNSLYRGSSKNMDQRMQGFLFRIEKRKNRLNYRHIRKKEKQERNRRHNKHWSKNWKKKRKKGRSRESYSKNKGWLRCYNRLNKWNKKRRNLNSKRKNEKLWKFKGIKSKEMWGLRSIYWLMVQGLGNLIFKIES